MKKNEERVGVVVGLGSNGEGILKEDGMVVFVPFALVGEKIRYRVLKVTSKCAYGKVLEVLTPAEIRVRANCPVFTKCGGCNLQHVKYFNQLKIKEDIIANCFKKIAGLSVDVKPAVKGDDEFRYRNKLQLPVQETSNGTVIGFYAENSHRVVQIDDCLINAPWTANVIKAFKTYFEEFNIKGYNELDKSGDVREITVKEVKGNLIVTAVVLNENIRGTDRLIYILKEQLKYTFSLYLNVNNTDTNVVYGEKFILLYGSPDYTGEMLGIKYKIGVRSFMQVNNSVCCKLYSAVRDAVDADDDTVVIDAYSGAGLMTALLAKNAKKAIGIEIIPEAVKCADDLALKNNLQNKICNHLGKCEDILPNLVKEEREKNSKICVVLDPPRKGCAISVIKALIDNDIDKIVYVSCLPSTLARDVGLLVGSLDVIDGEIKKVADYKPRYEVSLVRPYDMFANTKHVETLVCLTKIKDIIGEDAGSALADI
ncbi:MAG: 23S rRNA (uracil(1939)-C(5))-methyltransferase RlmD [Clostridia bacterium]|nr:23S rRNA (uracil(1939)-C(5))-methyltransferase RlmD [Clostridia bacterium]